MAVILSIAGCERVIVIRIAAIRTQPGSGSVLDAKSVGCQRANVISSAAIRTQPKTGRVLVTAGCQRVYVKNIATIRIQSEIRSALAVKELM